MALGNHMMRLITILGLALALEAIQASGVMAETPKQPFLASMSLWWEPHSEHRPVQMEDSRYPTYRPAHMTSLRRSSVIGRFA